MHALIINLTRFGDLLQTQPVIHALKEEGYTVGVVCLPAFADACLCLSGVSYIKPIPENSLLEQKNSNWYTTIATLQSWLTTLLDEFPATHVFNFTSHIPARILAKKIAEHPSKVVGFGVDEKGFGAIDSIWATFLEVSTKNRKCSPYNLVDIFRQMAHVGHIPPQNTLQIPKNTNIDHIFSFFEKQPHKKYIAFQLGASVHYRQWPVESFAYLGKQLDQNFGIMPVLIGAPSEQSLAEAYKKTTAPCIDLIGKTSIPELAQILSQHISLLVTNDTGSMHLAAGLKVPSLALFLATAQAYDTSPYLEHCCCIEPNISCHPCDFNSTCQNNYICRSTVTPEDVWAVLTYWIQTNTWPDTKKLPPIQTARIWKTVRDPQGFLDLECLSDHIDDRSIWFKIQRHFYRQFFESIETITSNKPYTKPYTPLEAINPELLSLSFRNHASSILKQTIDLLELLHEQSKFLKNQQIQGIGKKFIATTQKITILLTNSNYFNILGFIWETSLQNYGHTLAVLLLFCDSFKDLIIVLYNHISRQ